MKFFRNYPSSSKYTSIDGIRFSIWRHTFKMLAIYVISRNKSVATWSSVRQFLIYSTFILYRFSNFQLQTCGVVNGQFSGGTGVAIASYHVYCTDKSYQRRRTRSRATSKAPKHRDTVLPRGWMSPKTKSVSVTAECLARYDTGRWLYNVPRLFYMLKWWME